MRVAFNQVVGRKDVYEALRQAVELEDWSARGNFCQAAEARLEQIHPGRKMRLTTSGTTAIELVALQLNLSPNDNVIVPSFAYPACATAFTRAGAQVRFADIDFQSGSLCPESVARLLDERTRAVLTIHYAGACWRTFELAALCHAAGVTLLEDCAHAIGSTAGGRAGSGYNWPLCSVQFSP